MNKVSSRQNYMLHFSTVSKKIIYNKRRSRTLGEGIEEGIENVSLEVPSWTVLNYQTSFLWAGWGRPSWHLLLLLPDSAAEMINMARQREWFWCLTASIGINILLSRLFVDWPGHDLQIWFWGDMRHTIREMGDKAAKSKAKSELLQWLKWICI